MQKIERTTITFIFAKCSPLKIFTQKIGSTLSTKLKNNKADFFVLVIIVFKNDQFNFPANAVTIAKAGV